MLYENIAYSDPAYPVICHRDTLPHGAVVSAHWHENYEILSITGGRMELALDGKHFFAEAGQTVVIGQSVLHFLRPSDEICTYNCLLADAGFLKKRGLSASEVRYLEVIRDAFLSNIMESILRASESRQPLYRMEVCAQIDRLFVHLSRHYMLSFSDGMPDDSANIGVKCAVRYIHTHYDRPLTLDDICREVGFTKNYFCRIFAEYTGQPPIRYLYRVRCEDARRMLRGGECSVTDAAQRCGFSSVSHFSQYYRRTFGHSPSQDMI